MVIPVDTKLDSYILFGNFCPYSKYIKKIMAQMPDDVELCKIEPINSTSYRIWFSSSQFKQGQQILIQTTTEIKVAF